MTFKVTDNQYGWLS